MTIYDQLRPLILPLVSIIIAIVAHELGHVLAAYSVNCRVHRVKLVLYAYLLPYPTVSIDNPHHYGKNAWIALAAPGLNLGLVVIFGCLGLIFRSHLWSLLAAGQLVIGGYALLPYPGSDTWRAFILGCK